MKGQYLQNKVVVATTIAAKLTFLLLSIGIATSLSAQSMDDLFGEVDTQISELDDEVAAAEVITADDTFLVEFWYNNKKTSDGVFVSFHDEDTILLPYDFAAEQDKLLQYGRVEQKDGEKLFRVSSNKRLSFKFDQQRLSLKLKVKKNRSNNALSGDKGGTANKLKPVFGTSNKLRYNLSADQNGISNMSVNARSRVSLAKFGYVNANLNARRNSVGDVTTGYSDLYWHKDLRGQDGSVRVGDQRFSDLTQSGVSYVGMGLESFTSRYPFTRERSNFDADGQITTAGSVEVIINGTTKAELEVDAGDWTIEDLPLQSGVNLIKLIIRDASGELLEEKNLVRYSDTALLPKGSRSFNTAVGLVGRVNQFNEMEKKPFAGFKFQTGLGHNFTMEGLAAVQENKINLQTRFATSLNKLGLLRTVVAASNVDDTMGYSGNVSWQGPNKTLSFAGSMSYQNDYAPLSSRVQYGWQFGANANVSFRPAVKFGSLNAAVSYQKYEYSDDRLGLSLNYSKQIGRGSLGLNLSHQVYNEGQTRASLTYRVPLGKASSRTRMSIKQDVADQKYATRLNISRGRSGRTGWSHNLSTDYAKNKDEQQVNGSLRSSYSGERFGLNASARRNNGKLSATMSAETTISNVGKDVFVAKSVGSSWGAFATPGSESVPKKVNGRKLLSGKSNGTSFASSLSPWRLNRVAIDVADLPLDVSAETSKLSFEPDYGLAYKFVMPVQKIRPGVAVIFDASGEPVPSTSAIVNVEGKEIGFVGQDGETYFQNLTSKSNQFKVVGFQFECGFSIDETKLSQDGESDLGKISCL